MLKGKQTYLRPLELADLPSRVAWVNDPEIRSTLMFDYPLSLARTERWFRDGLTDESKRHFSIMVPENDRPIGMTGLLQIDRNHRRAQLYITVGEKEYQGRGIAREVIPLVLEYGFLELNLNKIFLYTLENNEKARTLYEKLGFVSEGVMRQHHYAAGKFHNLYQHAVLRENWA